MALHVPTNNPDSLLAALKAKIDNKLTHGPIRAWTYEPRPNGEEHFTRIDPHDRMDRAAWFRPLVEHHRVTFLIQPPPRSVSIPRNVYNAYHRLFLQTIRQHCYHLISTPTITPDPIANESPITHQPAHLAFR